MYSCEYPVNHTFQYVPNNEYIDYRILLNNNEIYKGRVSNGTSVTIDISTICREYVNVNNYSTFVLPVISASNTNIINSINTFVVDYEGTQTSYQIGYNCNADYEQPLPDSRNINFPISLDVDPRQMITITGYNLNGSNTVIFNNNETRTLTSQYYQCMCRILRTLNLVPGMKIPFQNQDYSGEYNVVAPCKNHYVLHYVNKAGGMDHLLMMGKTLVKWRAERTDCRFYNNRLERRDFENSRIHSDVKKRYELTSGWLTDEGASNIDHLIYSHNVWIEDLETNTWTSVIIEDNDYTVKNERNNTIVNYTIKCYESQLYLRK